MFVDGGRALIGSEGLSVYLKNPGIQTGPVSLLISVAASATPRNGFVIAALASGVLGLLLVGFLERSETNISASDPFGAQAKVLIGGCVLMFWWAKLGGYGHLDDALVLAATTGALLLTCRRRWVPAAVLIGIAIAIKPWAIIFLPLTMLPTGSLRARMKWPALSAIVGASWWLPFLIAYPKTLRSLRPAVALSADSPLSLLGLTAGSVPAALRSAQLVCAIALVAVAVVRGRSSGVVLVGVAARLMLDPGTWSYYTPGLVLGALIWDVLETDTVVPIATIFAGVMLVPAWVVTDASARAVLRTAACAGAMAVVLWPRLVRSFSERSRPAVRSRPTMDPSAAG
ncbi:MAG: hypothetical protein JWM34_3109 [Ilumatobacteraceae bacterium]|nr:hypothetical protein [Ilumatobacteraceae bacterium]